MAVDVQETAPRRASATRCIAAGLVVWAGLTGAAPGCFTAAASEAEHLPTAALSGKCRFTAGASPSDTSLIIGNLLRSADGADYGAMLISNGRIVAFVPPERIDAASRDVATFDCGGLYVSPGLINPHEHTSHSFQMLTDADRARLPFYAHRDEWNPNSGVGDSAAKIRFTPGTEDAKKIFWVELRHLLAGTTVIAGSGAVWGLAKNAGYQQREEYEYSADMKTFPFSRETMKQIRALPEGYPHQGRKSFLPQVTESLPTTAAYVPHVAEGTSPAATLEGLFFLDYVADNRSLRRFSLIHGVGLGLRDVRRMDDLDVTLIWSPRSNVSLYNATVDIAALVREKARIAIGTDWSISGSYNMLEELRCAAELYGSPSGSQTLSSADLWQMATRNGAYALGLEARTGRLAVGLAADIMIFRKQSDDPFDDLLRTTAREVVATFADGRLRSGNRNGFSSALPEDCSNTIGDHFICARLPNPARGLDFDFRQLRKANQQENTVPLYREGGQPFPNQAECRIRQEAV